MKYLRWLLFPFSLIYGLVIIIRNWCYDAGFFKSEKFSKPVISIGNLDVGGAGKSPMTEYLIRLLKDDYKLATLSRGYGRETKGFFIEPRIKNQKSRDEKQDGELTSHHSPLTTAHSPLTIHPSLLSKQIGDEPAQFKHKFPDITVAVCEKRAEGIKKLLPDHDLILMDDAYQHRAVEPGLSILLLDYSRINEPQLMLPAGNLREPFSGRWRAQIIVVTKCPTGLGFDEKTKIAQKIGPLPYQSLFFSSIAYQQLQDMDGKPANVKINKDTTVFLLTGIANSKPLLNYLNGFTSNIVHHNYPDHHPFTLKNISKLAAEYTACPSQKKIIITTEKDAQRLEKSWPGEGGNSTAAIPVFVIPIKVEFLDDSGSSFDKIVIEYVREHTTKHSIH